MNARLYDPVMGRFFSPDPVIQDFEATQSLNRYSYCQNKPVNRVDLDGRLASPVFDKNGNKLGEDEYGMQGEIIIADDPSRFTPGMKHSDALDLGEIFSMSRTDITMQNKNKILSKVIEGTELPNGSTIKSSDFYLTFDYDPDGIGDYKWDGNLKKHHVNLNMPSNEYTVENIRMVAGIHEIFGHGIMNWGSRYAGGGSHYKIFEAEMDSKYWNKSTDYIKQNTTINWWKYYGNEVVRKTGDNTVPQKYAAKFYKYGYGFYKK